MQNAEENPENAALASQRRKGMKSPRKIAQPRKQCRARPAI